MKKRTLNRRDFLRLSAAAATGAVMAACAPAAPEVVEVEKEVPVEKVVKETVEIEKVVEKPAKPKEPVRLRFSVWGDVQDKDVYTEVVYEFTQQQTDIIPKIEQYLGGYYEKIITNFAAGNAADIIYMQGWVWQPYVENEQLLSLDEYINEDGKGSWWPDFESFKESTRWHDHTYMTPTDTGGWVTFYNKDLFDKQGVPYPNDDWTWDDFRFAMENLTHSEGNDKFYSFAMHNWYPFFYLTPARKDGLLEWDRIVEPTQAKWTQEGIVEAMQWFGVDIRENGWEPTPSVLEGGGIMVWSGRVAMTFDGPWRLPRVWGEKADKEGGINFDVALVPKGESGKSETMPFIHGHCITSTTRHPDASWEFLKFILGDTGQEIIAKGGRQCGRPETMDKFWVPIATERYNFENAQAFIRALEQGRNPIIAGEGADLKALTAAGGPYPMAHDRLVEGDPAGEVLSEMNEGMQDILDDYWAKRA